MSLNTTQVNEALERLLLALAAWAVGKGYIAPEDATVYAGGLVAVFSAGVAIYNNRSKRLAEKAAAQGMTVIAPPNIADASKSPDVISSASVNVVPK